MSPSLIPTKKQTKKGEVSTVQNMKGRNKKILLLRKSRLTCTLKKNVNKV